MQLLHLGEKLKCTVGQKKKPEMQPHLLSSSFILTFYIFSTSPLLFSEIKFENEQASRPMLKPTANLEMLASDEEEEEAPKLQLLEEQESSIESSRSATPDV